MLLEQQKSLDGVNSYIEKEMINGRRSSGVLPRGKVQGAVRCAAANDELRENAASAGSVANIPVPIMMNIGNLLYVLVAVVGGALARVRRGRKQHHHRRYRVLPAADKSFTQPVTQISQPSSIPLLWRSPVPSVSLS